MHTHTHRQYYWIYPYGVCYLLSDSFWMISIFGMLQQKLFSMQHYRLNVVFAVREKNFVI